MEYQTEAEKARAMESRSSSLIKRLTVKELKESYKLLTGNEFSGKKQEMAERLVKHEFKDVISAEAAEKKFWFYLGYAKEQITKAVEQYEEAKEEFANKISEATYVSNVLATYAEGLMVVEAQAHIVAYLVNDYHFPSCPGGLSLGSKEFANAARELREVLIPEVEKVRKVCVQQLTCHDPWRHNSTNAIRNIENLAVATGTTEAIKTLDYTLSYLNDANEMAKLLEE